MTSVKAQLRRLQQRDDKRHWYGAVRTSVTGAQWPRKRLQEAGISIDRMRQYGHTDTAAPVLIVTHKTTRATLDHALGGLDATGVLAADPVAIRIEEV